MHTNFRDHLCHCASCFPLLKPHPQLLEEEETYEPPISEDGEGEQGGSVGTGSLLDRGEAAFNNIDRVRAIGAYILLFLYCIFHCGPAVLIR
jgi:E3 ubiquitin-protein ligase UBR7